MLIQIRLVCAGGQNDVLQDRQVVQNQLGSAHRSVSYYTMECELLHTGVSVNFPEVLPEEMETFQTKNIANGYLRRQKSTLSVNITEYWYFSLNPKGSK